MAQQLNSEPSDSLLWASEAAVYDIGVTTVPGANEDKKVGYQVYSQDVGGGNNVALNSVRKTRPVVSLTDNIKFDATPLIRSSLGVTIPTLDGTTTAIEAVDFVKEFYLDYSEVIINQTTGVPTINTSSSTTKKIINSYVQDYQSITKGTQHVLTDKKWVCIFDDCHDWILTYGDYDVTFTYYNESGQMSSQQFTDLAADNKAYLIPSGPAQLTLPAGTTKYKAEFATGEIIWYAVKKAPWPANERLDIYFLEPKGSWSVMPFKMIREEISNRDFYEVIRSGELTNDVSTIFSTYARDIKMTRSWMSFRAEKDTAEFDDNAEFYRAFGNARQYRAAYRHSEGTKSQLLAPIIPGATSIPTSAGKSFYKFKFNGYFGVDLNV